MQHHFNNAQDQFGNGVVRASVLVQQNGVTSTIYSDNGSTIKANPMTTGAAGAFDFYAANGNYTLSITAANGSVTTSAVTLFDPDSLSASSGAGLVGYGTGTVADALDATTSLSGAAAPLCFRSLFDINPVLPSSRTPTVANHVKDPAVYVGATNIYLFFSFGRDDGTTGGWNIGYAKSSTQASFDFTYMGTAIPQGADGSYDELGLFAPSPPLLVAGTYYLWYVAAADRAGTNNKNIGAAPQAPWCIALATAASLDGPWTKQGVVIDGMVAGHTLDPWVLPPAQTPDGLYRMYVSQPNGGSARKVVLYKAPAPTGPWTRYGVVFDPLVGVNAWPAGHDVENPAVVKVGSYYYLTVDDASSTRSHVAVSADGLAFTEMEGGPLTGPNYSDHSSLNLWDQAGSDALAPFWLNDQLFAAHQAFQGGNTNGAWSIGLAELGRPQQRWPVPPAKGSAVYAPKFGSVTASMLAEPGTLAVTATGGGATTYTYVAVFTLPDGTHTAASASASVTNAATLDATNYNAVQVPVAPMGVLCEVYRTVGGATQGKITNGVAPGSAVGQTIIDNGLTGDGTTAPASNTTGSIAAANALTCNNFTASSAGATWLRTDQNTVGDALTRQMAPTGKGIYNWMYANGTQLRWVWGRDYSTDDFFVERHTGAGGTGQGKPFNIENATGYVQINGFRIAFGTAAPVAGTWALGDRMLNSTPAVGQPKGWACTVAGTPGTWVSEGNL